MTYINHEVWAMLQLGVEGLQLYLSLLAGIVVGFKVHTNRAKWFTITLGIGVIGFILVVATSYAKWQEYHDWVQPIPVPQVPNAIIMWLQTRNFGLLASVEGIATMTLCFILGIVGMWIGRFCPARRWFVLGMTVFAVTISLMSIVVMYKWFSEPINLASNYRPSMANGGWTEWYVPSTICIEPP